MKRLESKRERIERSKQSVLEVVKAVMADETGSESGKKQVLAWAESQFAKLEAELADTSIN